MDARFAWVWDLADHLKLITSGMVTGACTVYTTSDSRIFKVCLPIQARLDRELAKGVVRFIHDYEKTDGVKGKAIVKRVRCQPTEVVVKVITTDR